MSDSPLNIVLPPLDKQRRYTVEQALLYLSTSRVTLYKLIHAKKIKAIKEGRRTYIPGSEIVRVSSAQS
jgi:excisionase family DNA binding protein